MAQSPISPGQFKGGDAMSVYEFVMFVIEAIDIFMSLIIKIRFIKDLFSKRE